MTQQTLASKSWIQNKTFWFMCIFLFFNLNLSMSEDTASLKSQPVLMFSELNSEDRLFEKGRIVYPEGQDRVIRLGVLAKRGVDICIKEWVPTVNYLTANIPEYRFLLVPLRFEEVSPAVREKKIDFLITNTSQYTQLDALYEIPAIATLKNLRLGEPYTVFGGVIFTRKDEKNIHEIQDLKGKRFAAVDPHSFGGWQMAWLEMKQNGIDPKKDLHSLDFIGTHDAVVKTVLTGEADAGTVRTETLERMQSEGLIDEKELRVLHQRKTDEDVPFVRSTALYPEWPIVKLPHLHESLAQDVAGALIGIPAESEVAKAAHIAGWTIPTSYQIVHDCLKQLQIGPYENFGKITLRQLFYHYWALFLLGVIIITGAIGVAIWKSFMHSRIEESERKLAQSEKQLAATLHSIVAGVIACDIDGRITNINKAAEIMTGWTSSEAVGNPIQEAFRIISAENRETADNPVFQALAEGVSVDLTNHTVLIAKDGTERQIAYSSAPIRDKSGTIIGAVLVFRNVTEEYRQKQELKISKERFEKIAEQSRSITWEVDTNGLYTYVSRTSESVLGYKPEEMVGKMHFYDLHPEGKRDAFKTAALKVFERKEPFVNVKNHALTKTGQLMWFSTNGLPIMDQDGKLLGYRGNDTDITKQKKAEDELHRFKMISEKSVFGQAISDPHGKLIYVNKFFADVHGYIPDELIGRNINVLHSPEQKEEVEQTISDMQQSGHFEPTEIWHIHRNGKTFPMLMTGLAIKNEDNEIEYFATSAIDITKSKQAEKALQESESRFRDLLENMDRIPVQGYDEQRKVIYWNAASEQVYGYTREEAHGCLLEELIIPPDMRSEVINATDQWLAGGSGISAEEHVLQNKQGDPVNVYSSHILHLTASGNKEMYCVDIDLRDLKVAENKLRKSEHMFRSFVENANDIVYALSSEGVFTYISPNWLDFMGEPAEKAIGKSFEPYVHPEDLNLCRSFLEKTLMTGKKQSSVEYRVRHKDGSWRWHVSTGAPVRDSSGVITGFVGIARDITAKKNREAEHKQLQHQLAQSQKMESIGRLAGGVAHDFNNMLMGIMCYTDMCRDDIAEDHPIQEWLREITNETERSARLTQQLLAFARKQTISPQVLDLNDEIGNMLKMLRRLIGEDIEIFWVPSSELWLVKMDHVQVDQILANLCINARDAIGGAGKVTIETNNVSIDEKYCGSHEYFYPGEFVMLTISDNGCGMDSETMDKIFEPFFTTKGIGEGTGLGLATVYGIVKQNEGFINVYSEPGQGTTLRIYLPRLAEDNAKLKNKTESDSSPGGTETILLVEDEHSILATLKMFLKKLGYTVLAAESSEAALKIASDHTHVIDLLLTDVVMPGINGRELAEKLITDYPNLKVLYMSGYTADVIAQKDIIPDNMNFISKPIPRNALARKVREMLDHD
jgi:two-component system, cell cycle sensor histidine kinase and response regulator CckA